MLRQWRYVAAFALLMAFGSLAQSYQPTPSGRKGSQPEQSQANQAQKSAPSDQRGTEQFPPIVKILQPGNGAPNFNQVPEQHDDKSTTDWLLVIFTGLLVVVGFGQGIVFAIQAHRLKQTVDEMRSTTFFFKASADAAKASAEAATLSAQAAIAIELPIIRANVGNLGFSTNLDEKGERCHDCWIDELTFSNHGRTKAFPVEVQFDCTIGDELPIVPVYGRKKSFPPNAILDSDQIAKLRLDEFNFPNTSDIYERLRTRSVSLWFYCNLVYMDFMQNSHESGFCWKQHGTSGMGDLSADPTPAYNRKT